jgi:spore germination cell wall hydrolase CwlJ-like protein
MADIAISATIFNEARGESSAGRQAVKAVIQNRVAYACPKK